VALFNFFSSFGAFPWTWWASAAPVIATFFTAWLVQERLKKTDSSLLGLDLRDVLKAGVFVYQGLTVALIVRLVFGLVPDADVRSPSTHSELSSWRGT
jgi:hypothetical protein